jgi:hydroxyethylthiazole kinase-like uncharacterized protein yjeF
MRDAHIAEEVRAAEGTLMARLPDGALMQRAATGLAAVCAGLLGQVYGSRVVILAGTGDNGGDGLYAGAMLARRGAVVAAVMTGDRLHPGGAAALTAAGGRLVAAIGPTSPAAADPAAGPSATPGDEAAGDEAAGLIGAADLIIDGMLGIGGRGGLREPGATLAAWAEAARTAPEPALVVAVDLPSGIDADTGEVRGPAVRADVTVTFGTWKPGLLIDPAAARAGTAELVDIGLGPCLGRPAVTSMQAADVAALLPNPTAETDKYRRGVLGIVAGSSRYTGAATLSTGGALRGGAGMIRLVSAEHPADLVRQHWPEAVITVVGADATAQQAVPAAGRVQAWVAGPGMGTGDDAVALLTAVLASDVPVLVDADGLTVLAAHRELLPRSAPTLITPHAGELARLLGADRADVEARRLEHARRAAGELGVTVLLKGSTTVIVPAQEGRPVLVNPTGTGWLATAGSGDVLSGLAGALLAQGLATQDAAAVGAYLHGLAGRLAATGATGPGGGGYSGADSAAPSADQLAGGSPIGAADLISALPAAIRITAAAG